MKRNRIALGGVGLAALAIAVAGAEAQKTPGETVVYWMTADTSAGLGAMAGGNARGMVGALLRGGNRPSHAHALMLQLGSGRRATGEPSAEHVPPTGLQAGASLPLRTPPKAQGTATPNGWPANVERPKGRMLFYWGCGERARAGQPVVVDFASMSAGKIPPAFANANVRYPTPPSTATSATYGEWPNERSEMRVPPDGSLVGEHVVRGNYAPEMRFTVAAGQDYLAPVSLTANAKGAGGSVPLSWRAVPGAKAWLVSTMGSGANGDFVMWSSSETQMAAMMMDHLPDAEIARLV